MANIDNAHIGQDDHGYDTLLAEFTETAPRIGCLLGRAQRNRTIRLRFWSKSGRLAGLEEFVGYLDTLAARYVAAPSLVGVAFLITRVREDFDTAIEGALSGMHGVVGEAMRDVMEIEFLLRDFLYVPGNLERWLVADDTERRRRFSSNSLRQRDANRRGVEVKDLRDSHDYWAHSMALHVAPPIPNLAEFGMVKGVMEDDDPLAAEFCFEDMFAHAKRLVTVAFDLAEQHGPQQEARINLEDRLPLFMAAWHHTQETLDLIMSRWQSARSRAMLDTLMDEVVAAHIAGTRSEEDRQCEERLLSWVMREEVYAQCDTQIAALEAARRNLADPDAENPMDGLRLRMFRALVAAGRRVADSADEMEQKQAVLAILLILRRPDVFIPRLLKNLDEPTGQRT